MTENATRTGAGEAAASPRPAFLADHAPTRILRHACPAGCTGRRMGAGRALPRRRTYGACCMSRAATGRSEPWCGGPGRPIPLPGARIAGHARIEILFQCRLLRW